MIASQRKIKDKSSFIYLCLNVIRPIFVFSVAMVPTILITVLVRPDLNKGKILGVFLAFFFAALLIQKLFTDKLLLPLYAACKLRGDGLNTNHAQCNPAQFFHTVRGLKSSNVSCCMASFVSIVCILSAAATVLVLMNQSKGIDSVVGQNILFAVLMFVILVPVIVGLFCVFDHLRAIRRGSYCCVNYFPNRDGMHDVGFIANSPSAPDQCLSYESCIDVDARAQAKACATESTHVSTNVTGQNVFDGSVGNNHFIYPQISTNSFPLR